MSLLSYEIRPHYDDAMIRLSYDGRCMVVTSAKYALAQARAGRVALWSGAANGDFVHYATAGQWRALLACALNEWTGRGK